MNPIYLDMLAVRALRHYGESAQKLKAIEELNELSVALARDLNNCSRHSSEVIDEIADVKIMLEQLIRMKNIDRDAVHAAMDAKMIRLERLMNEGSGSNG